MEATLPGYEHHIFVCENVRPADHPRGCCGAKGSPAVRARLKELIRMHGLKGRVRANQSGCLDCCETGPTVVIYPEGVWYRGVGVAEAEEIFHRHVLGGEVVERLRLRTTGDGKTPIGPDAATTSGSNAATTGPEAGT